MQQEALRDVSPPALRKYLLQSLFDLFRIVRVGQTQSIRHPFHMRIDYHSRLAESRPQYDVGGFSSHTWNRR
jgi:hypothetical protein